MTGSCVAFAQSSMMGSCWPLLLLVLFAFAAFAAWSALTKGSSGQKPKTRNVMTQSQTRYAFDRMEPRFALVPTGADGAWPDFDLLGMGK